MVKALEILMVVSGVLTAVSGAATLVLFGAMLTKKFRVAIRTAKSHGDHEAGGARTIAAG